MLLIKVYDISQEVFSCKVYPGDPTPQKQVISSIDDGNLYNLSAIGMCTHNGTHIDAPYHFIKEGKTVEQIDINKFVGPCIVVTHGGVMTASDAENILQSGSNDALKRILIKGDATVSAEAATVFANSGIYLLGNESQSVGPLTSPMEVHKILLQKGVVLLEGIRLNDVKEGEYILCAAPLNLAGCDGSPCRAVLIEK